MQYIDFSETAHVVKAVITVINIHFKLINSLSGQSHFESVSPEWRLNLGFGTGKKCTFPVNRVNRGNRYKDYVNIFVGPNFVSR